MSKHAQEAKRLFKEGYNCAQAVLVAFSDLTNLDTDLALKLSSSFGGGMGRLREVCGAVSGAFMVLGTTLGYNDTENNLIKKEHYQRVQQLASEFEKEFGSIVCRDLLNLDKKKDNPTPDKRTKSYYKKRPCVECVEFAANMLDNFFESINFDDQNKTR